MESNGFSLARVLPISKFRCETSLAPGKIASDCGCAQRGGIPPREEKLVSHHRIRRRAGLNHLLGGSSAAPALSILRLTSQKWPACCALCIDSTTSDLGRRLVGGGWGMFLAETSPFSSVHLSPATAASPQTGGGL